MGEDYDQIRDADPEGEGKIYELEWIGLDRGANQTETESTGNEEGIGRRKREGKDKL